MLDESLIKLLSFLCPTGLCKIYLLQALDYSQSPYELEIATYDGDKNPYYDSTVGDNTTTLVVTVQQREMCDISVADGITETIDDVDLVDDGVVADVDASSSCDGEEDDIMFTLDEEVYVDGTGGMVEYNGIHIYEDQLLVMFSTSSIHPHSKVDVIRCTKNGSWPEEWQRMEF